MGRKNSRKKQKPQRTVQPKKQATSTSSTETKSKDDTQVHETNTQIGNDIEAVTGMIESAVPKQEREDAKGTVSELQKQAQEQLKRCWDLIEHLKKMESEWTNKEKDLATECETFTKEKSEYDGLIKKQQEHLDQREQDLEQRLSDITMREEAIQKETAKLNKLRESAEQKFSKEGERIITKAENDAQKIEKKQSEAKAKQDAEMVKQRAALNKELSTLRQRKLDEITQELDERRDQFDQECEERRQQLDNKEKQARDKRISINDELHEQKRLLEGQRVSLEKRESAAESGFLEKRDEILGDLEEMQTATKAKMDAMKKEARTRIQNQQQQWEEERSKQEADIHQKMINTQAQLHQDKQTSIDQLQERLKEIEREHQIKLQEQEDTLLEREHDLQAKEKAFRVQERDLEMKEEIFNEDKEALQQKVERLVQERHDQILFEKQSLEKELDSTKEQREQFYEQLQLKKAFEQELGDRSAADVMAEIKELRLKNKDLEIELENRADDHTIERLAKLNREHSELRNQYADLQSEKITLAAKLSQREIAVGELQNLKDTKEALEVHNNLLNSTIKTLRKEVDDIVDREQEEHPMKSLLAIDKAHQEAPKTDSPVHGKRKWSHFAADFRHRIAQVEARPLYYSEKDIRAFLAGMAMSKLLLLQGISGTGKTSLARAAAKTFGGGYEIVEVQAGWRDRQDLLGYYNAFHKHYYTTKFLQALYRAGTPEFQDRIFIIVLDEMNLSRPEQFFADFLSALEQPEDERSLTLHSDAIPGAPKLLQQDGKELPIPPNVWFIGTANHDESTIEFADKTYDRAHVMEMPRKSKDDVFKLEPMSERDPISHTKFQSRLKTSVKKYESEATAATMWLEDQLAPKLNAYQIGWGDRLKMQIETYVPMIVSLGGTLGEAMDHIVCTRILRKLKGRYDISVDSLKRFLDELLELWDELDGETYPEKCEAFLNSEILKKGDAS